LDKQYSEIPILNKQHSERFNYEMKIKQYGIVLNVEQRRHRPYNKSTFPAEVGEWFTVGAIINEFLNHGKPINTGRTDIAWHFNEDDKRRLRNLYDEHVRKTPGTGIARTYADLNVRKRAIVSSENSIIMRRLLDLYVWLRADEPL